MKKWNSWSELKGKIKFYNLITMTLVFFLFYYLNISVRYCTDDWHFKFVFYGFWPQDGVQRVRNLRDIVSSASMYYQLSGGRVLAHGLTFALLMIPQGLFDLLNTVMLVLFGYFGYLMVDEREWREHWYSLPAIYLGVILFSFSLGDSVLWLSGAVNYLWMGALNLFTIFIFEKVLEKQKKRTDYVLLSVLFFMSGQSNETTGGMLLILLFLYLVHKKEQWKENRLLFLCTALATVSGMMIVLLAPGNYNRAMVVHGGTGSFQSITSCILHLVTELLNQCWILFAIALYSFFENRKKEGIMERLFHCRFVVAGAAGACALGLSNTMIMRGTFLPIVYILIGACGSLQGIISAFDRRTGIPKTKTVFQKLIYVFLGLEVLYFLVVCLQRGFQFAENEIAFLTRGMGVIVLLLIIPILLRERKDFSGIIKLGKVVIPVLAFVILLFEGSLQFSFFVDNSEKQMKLEESIKTSVYHPEENVLISWPIYQDSMFWPKEASVSAEYTKAWMETYIKTE